MKKNIGGEGGIQRIILYDLYVRNCQYLKQIVENLNIIFDFSKMHKFFKCDFSKMHIFNSKITHNNFTVENE